MTLPFSEQEIASLADLVRHKRVLDEHDFAVIGKRQPVEYFNVVNQYRPMLVAPKLNANALMQKVNEDLASSGKKSQSLHSKRVAAPIPPTLSLPPKMRAKAIAASTETPTKGSNQIFIQEFDTSLGSKHNSRFPFLLKTSSLPLNLMQRYKSSDPPEIGSLAVIIHPSIGSVQVCRILAKKDVEKERYYLVSFFAKQNTPCYVQEQSLMKIDYGKGFPFNDHSDDVKEVSVDWLLERIISTAQDFVISNGELLPPVDSGMPGSMGQHSVLCNVVCASFMILCYTAGRWKIPKPKLKLIFETISKTCPPKYESSRRLVDEVEEKLADLLSLDR